MRDRWPVSVGAPLSVAVLAVIVHLSFRSLLFDAVAFVLLSASLLKYLAPTHMRADAEGMTVQFLLHTRRYAWDQFRACRDMRDGLMLTMVRPEAQKPVEVLLPVPPGCEEAREYVRARIG